MSGRRGARSLPARKENAPVRNSAAPHQDNAAMAQLPALCRSVAHAAAMGPYAPQRTPLRSLACIADLEGVCVHAGGASRCR